MKYFNKINIAALIVFIYPLLLHADIVKKEGYSIQSQVKYKQNLDIAVLSFSGDLRQERNYIKDLIRNAIIDRILLYGKFHFNSYKDYTRNYFSTPGNSTDITDSQDKPGIGNTGSKFTEMH